MRPRRDPRERRDHLKLSFPDGFVWGTATAAHQIEGNNVASDWWEWEHRPDTVCVEPSGDACDSWHRWHEDIALVREMGLQRYRFSIEWSRIEPERGEWSHATVDHYRRICRSLRDAGIEPMVTFHHFTNPRWVITDGGWAAPHTADRFADFCRRASAELGPELGGVCTLNEPNVVAVAAYLGAAFPPGERSVERRRQANRVLIDAHRRAVDAIRAEAPGVPVGMTLAIEDLHPVEGGDAKLEQIRYRMQDEFLEATAGDDFVGVQTYTRRFVGPRGFVPIESSARLTALGYEFYPESLAGAVRRVWDVTKGGVPIVVTENGIATNDDEERIEYVAKALRGLHECITDGIDVRGYTYWSLLDNFEWMSGYAPRFGIVEVDRSSFVRTPKPSAKWLGEVARVNAVELPSG